VNAVDNANAAAPAGNLTPAPDTRAITVNAILAVNLQTVPASPNPTLPAGQAVVGRTYGFPSVPAAPAKTNVVYEVTGGLPAALAPLYTITPSGTLTTATNIVCTAGSTTATCNSGGAAVTNTGGLNPSLTISATDTFNSTTPAVAPPAAKTDVWTVNPAIAFSLAPGPTGVVPNGVIPDGVVGRIYGTGTAVPSGSTDLVFTASGGLGNTAGFGLTGTAAGTFVGSIPASNSGLVCAPAGSQVGASVSVTCNSGGGTSALGGTATGKTLVMTFDDGGNSTTPVGPTSTDIAGYNNYSNTVQPILKLTLQTVPASPDPVNANAFAVVGRTYGAPNKASVVYEASGGLTPYSGSLSGTLLANSNICAVPTITATTLACHSNNSAVTGTSGSLTVRVDDDTTNLLTPSGNATLTKAYTVKPAVTMTVAPDPASPTTIAVVGRPYGTPAGVGFSSPTYTAIDGLGIYTYSISNPPGANITCSTGVIATSVCASANVSAVAPVSFDLIVQDDVGGSSLTTDPDLVGVTITKTFTVNPALVITTASVPNGLLNFTYVPTGPGVTLQATGGLGGNSWVPGGISAGPCAPAISTIFPPGLTLGAASGLLSGTLTAASPAGTDYTFEVCVFDTPNTTTDRGAPAVLPTYTLNVFDTLAAVAAPGNDSVEVINTTSNTFFLSIPLAAGSFPAGVAVTPNGRKTYVTLNVANDVVVIDNITGVATALGGLGTCLKPRGIAIGLPGGLPVAFVACTNGELAAIDAATDTFLGSAPFGSPGASFYGVAITPDDALLYATDVGNDQFVVLDAISFVPIFASPFAAGVTTPHGIIISNDGNRVYIAGSLSNDVNVLNTADNTTQTIGATIPTGGASLPESFAITPDGLHVYVTLFGGNAVAVIADSAAPALLGGNGTALGPFGVTIPPLLVVPVTGVRVYITQSGFHNVAIYDDETVTPFGINAASPIALSGATPSPIGIAHIPVPR